MAKKKYTSKDIAEWFINRAAMISEQYDEESLKMTNLRLQKIVYYAQACQMALKNEKLFDEPIEAWDYGPVVSSLYHEYKRCGAHVIEPTYFPDIDDETAIMLEFIYQFFGKFTGEYLVALTHEEEPYISAYTPNKMHNIMNDDKIKKIFKEKWLEYVDIDDKAKAKEYKSVVETLNIYADPEIKAELQKPREQYFEDCVPLEDIWDIK